MNDVSSWFVAVISALITASLLSLVLGLFAMILEKTPNARKLRQLIYGLWFLSIFRLMLIVAPASSWSILNLCSDDGAWMSRRLSPVSSSEFDLPVSVQPSFSEPIAGREVFTNPGSTSIWLNVGYMAIFIWTVGVILLFNRLAKQFLEIRRIINRAYETSTISIEQIGGSIGSAILPPGVALRITEDLPVPAVVGILHPTILIPKWCEQELTREQLELVVTHELIHVRRKDLLVQLLAHLVRIVHWFNPLAYVATARLAHWQEIICDHQISAMFQREPGKRTVYRETLVQIFTRASEQPRIKLATGFIGATNVRRDGKVCDFIERIQMLQQPLNHSTTTTLLTTFGLIILLAVGFTSAQEQQNIAEKGNLVQPGDNQNPKYAIKLTMYKGSSEEVRPIIEKMNSLIDTEQVAKVVDFVNANGERENFLFDLGSPESELQIEFGNSVKQLKNSEVTLIANNERPAEYFRGAEIPRLNSLGKIEFDAVGDQYTLTPTAKNGQVFLSVTLTQSELNLEKMIKVKTPDGSIVDRPQIFSDIVESAICLDQANSAVVAALPAKLSGERTLVKIECSELSPDQKIKKNR